MSGFPDVRIRYPADDDQVPHRHYPPHKSVDHEHMSISEGSPKDLVSDWLEIRVYRANAQINSWIGLLRILSIAIRNRAMGSASKTLWSPVRQR